MDNSFSFEQAFPAENPNGLLLTEKQANIINPPGTATDMEKLETEASKIATSFFTEKILPEMEKLVP